MMTLIKKTPTTSADGEIKHLDFAGIEPGSLLIEAVVLSNTPIQLLSNTSVRKKNSI